MYLLFNNKIKEGEDFKDICPNLDLSLPIFNYKVFISDSVVTLWDYHKEYFRLISKYLQLDIPNFLNSYDVYLKRLVIRSKLFKGAIVKIYFYPYKNTLNFIAFPYKSKYRFFNVDSSEIKVIEPSYKIEAFEFNKFYLPPIHSYIYKEEFVICREEEIINTKSYNIITIYGKTIIAPALKSNAKFNPFLFKVLEILNNYGYKIIDKALTKQEIVNAENFWLVSEQTIYTRTGYGTIRYYTSDLAEKIVNDLNKMIFKRQ